MIIQCLKYIVAIAAAAASPGAQAQFSRAEDAVKYRQGTLFAVPFDLDRLVTTGPEVPLIEGISTLGPPGTADYTVAQTGMLLYMESRISGTLFSWAVVRRAFLPAFADRVPFVTALVALAEDPAVRLCTYVVDAAPEDLVADAPVAVSFRPLEFTTVPGRSVVVPMFART